MDNFWAHILAVDDDEGIRSLVKKYLNDNIYIVNTAESAEGASKKINIIKFDFLWFIFWFIQLYLLIFWKRFLFIIFKWIILEIIRMLFKEFLKIIIS